jgi:hypothetical protein
MATVQRSTYHKDCTFFPPGQGDSFLKTPQKLISGDLKLFLNPYSGEITLLKDEIKIIDPIADFLSIFVV